MGNEVVAQSVNAANRVRTKSRDKDNQPIKDDPQQIAARIAERLLEAGYGCIVLDPALFCSGFLFAA